MSVENWIKKLARDAGFPLVRIGAANELHVERARYLAWIAEGRHGEMRWIDADWAMKASDPRATVADAQSVLSLGQPYWAGHRPASSPKRGKIARYAWGRDYHRALGEKMENLVSCLQSEFGGQHRWFVDTGPAMDKALAAHSGLGWYGKNTNILTAEFGSFVLLGEIVTTLALTPDLPIEQDCGKCRLCIHACPTGALGPEYSIDARKCISYLTIEHRGPIPLELRAAMGVWVFGCDICQDVCPPTMDSYLRDLEERRAWASEVRRQLGGPAGEAASLLESKASGERLSDWAPSPSKQHLFGAPVRADIDLIWLLQLTHDQYLEAFRGTAIRRAKFWMLRRNAAIALGNVGDEGAIEPLRAAMVDDEHPIVRSHAAWALGHLAERLGRGDVKAMLFTALRREGDPDVRVEVELAAARIHAGARDTVISTSFGGDLPLSGGGA